MRILFVEDEWLVRDTIAQELRDAGFDVLEATTGDEALALASRERFDLLFTDIRVPGPDGWEIAEACRARYPNLPVVYATGYSPNEPRIVPGGRLFLKPYHMAQVLTTIRELAGGSHPPGRA